MPARKSQSQSPCHLIPPAEMFNRVLPGPLMLHADKPFEQRVEIAWRRLVCQFHDDEYEQMREVLRELLARETTLKSPAS